jgi:hypothetical protein
MRAAPVVRRLHSAALALVAILVVQPAFRHRARMVGFFNQSELRQGYSGF